MSQQEQIRFECLKLAIQRMQVAEKEGRDIAAAKDSETGEQGAINLARAYVAFVEHG